MDALCPQIGSTGGISSISAGEMQDTLPLPCPCSLGPSELVQPQPGQAKIHFQAKAVGFHVLSGEQSLAPKHGC